MLKTERKCEASPSKKARQKEAAGAARSLKRSEYGAWASDFMQPRPEAVENEVGVVPLNRSTTTIGPPHLVHRHPTYETYFEEREGPALA